MTAKPWSVADRLALARHRLSLPPEREHIMRPVVRGETVAAFILPLELCQSQNQTRHNRQWEHAKIKTALFKIMSAQYLLATGLCCASEPLPGRPQVLAVRFSPVAPDAYANYAKAAIDMLCSKSKRGRQRLGIIRDDSPVHIEEHQWWEPMPRGEGFVFLEVRA